MFTAFGFDGLTPETDHTTGSLGAFEKASARNISSNNGLRALRNDFCDVFPACSWDSYYSF